MIFIKNTQRKINIDREKIASLTQKILDILHYSDFDISIWFTTNKKIREFNKTYRNKDKPTDILSFAYHQNLKPGQKIRLQTEDDKNIGDIIISSEYVENDLKNWNQTFDARIKILLVHGICHLLGYDHETDEDYKIMNTKEHSILKKLN